MMSSVHGILHFGGKTLVLGSYGGASGYCRYAGNDSELSEVTQMHFQGLRPYLTGVCCCQVHGGKAAPEGEQYREA
jgi:hypothetical protein